MNEYGSDDVLGPACERHEWRMRRVWRTFSQEWIVYHRKLFAHHNETLDCRLKLAQRVLRIINQRNMNSNEIHLVWHCRNISRLSLSFRSLHLVNGFVPFDDFSYLQVQCKINWMAENKEQITPRSIYLSSNVHVVLRATMSLMIFQKRDSTNPI